MSALTGWGFEDSLGAGPNPGPADIGGVWGTDAWGGMAWGTAFGGAFLVRTGVDSAPASEVATRQVVLPRRGDDSLLAALSGLVSRLVQPVFATRVTTGSAMDAASAFLTSGRNAGDSAPASDSGVRTATLIRSTSDSAPAAEAVSRTVVALRRTGYRSPDAIAGLAAWLDASQVSGVPPGDVVSGLDSGGVLPTSWTAQNGGPTFQVDGVSGQPFLYQTASPGTGLRWAQNLSATSSTVFVVARMRGPAKGRILAGLSNNWLLGWHGGTQDDHYAEGWVYNSATGAGSDLLAYAAVRDHPVDQQTFLRNGTALASISTAASQSPNGLTTSGHVGASEFSDADLFEVLVYSRALTPAEVDVVFGYLGGKYTLSVAAGAVLPEDLASAADTISDTRLLTRSASDASTASDTSARVLSTSRSATEAEPLTDGPYRDAVAVLEPVAHWSLGDTALRYRWYRNPTTVNAANEAALDALFTGDPAQNSAFGGSGVQDTILSWGSSGVTAYFTVAKPTFLPADNYAFLAEGWILVPETGTWGFQVDGDDAVDLHIDGTNVANWYAGHGWAGTYDPAVKAASRTGTIFLTKGLHRFRARCQEGAGGDGINVGWKAPSASVYSSIPASAYVWIPYAETAGAYPASVGTGTPTPTPSVTPSDTDGATFLPADGSFLSHPIDPEWDPATKTVSVWVRPQGWNGTDTVIRGLWQNNNDATTNFSNWVWLGKYSNILYFRVMGAGGQMQTISTSSAGVFLDGTPVLVTASYSAADGMRLYVNGTQVASGYLGSLVVPSINPQSAGRIGFGHQESASNTALDEVAVFNRALSATEVAWLYAAGQASVLRQVVLTRTSTDTAPVSDASTATSFYPRSASDDLSASYLAEVLADSPVDYWPLVQDGRNLAGGAAVLLPGSVEHVDGPGQGSAVHNAASPRVATSVQTQAISYEMWIKHDPAVDTITNYESFGGMYGTGNRFAVQRLSTGTTAYLRIDTSAQINSTGLGVFVLDGLWHHVVWTGEGGIAKVFVDGQQTGSMSYPHGAGWDITSVAVVEAEESRAQVAWYVTALTPAQVLAHYQRGPGTSRGVAEQVVHVRQVLRTGGDSAPASDEVSHLRTSVRTASDTAPAVDDSLRQSDRFRTSSDSPGSPSDVAVRSNGVFVRATADSAGAEVWLDRTTVLTRSVGDSAPVSDATVRNLGWFYRDSSEWLTGTPQPISDLPSYTWHVDAAESDDGTTITDLAGSGITMTLSAGTREAHNGVLVWNMDSGQLAQTGGADYVLGRNHTVWAWVDWRDSDSGWRTLHRGDNDHWILVENGAKRLGMFSNRNGGFRPTTYNINPSGWQLVVAVGRGETDTGAFGETDFYINGEYVGTVDRVSSGTYHNLLGYNLLGYSSQGPGRVAAGGTFASEALTAAQVRDLYERTRAKYGYVEPSDPAPSDAAVRSVVLVRTAVDVAPATETATRESFLPRTTADSAPASDAALRQISLTRSASDTAPASDTVARTSTLPRITNDSAPAADSASAAGTSYRRLVVDIAAARDTRNLIRNSSAEQDLTDIFESPVYAPALFAHTRVTGLNIPGGPDTGVQVDIQAGNHDWGMLSKWTTESIPAGTEVTYGFWARKISGTATSISAAIYNNPATVNVGAGGSFALTTDWTFNTLNFTTIVDLRVHSEFLRFNVGTGGTAQTYQIAGVMLVPGPVAPTYPEPTGADRQTVLVRSAADIAGTPVSPPRTGGLVQPVHHEVFAETSTLPYIGDAAAWQLSIFKSASDSAPASDSATRGVVLGRAAADNLSGSYVAGLLADSPVGYWRLGEASGTLASDASGHASDGEYVGNITRTAGLLVNDSDGAFANEVNDTTYPRVRFGPNPTWVPLGQQYAFEAWVQTTTTRVKALFTYGAGNNLLALVGTTNTTLYSGASAVNLAHSNVADGQPHHYALVHDGTQARVFIDGAPGPWGSLPTIPVASGGYFVLGQEQDGNDAAFDLNQSWVGTIDEFAAYDYPLSPTQIQSHYEQGITATGGIEDLVSRAVVLIRTAPDTAPATDAATRALVLPRSAGDSAPASDAATRQALPYIRSTDDAAPAVEQNTDQPRGFFRSGADSIAGLGDAPTRQGTFARGVYDLDLMRSADKTAWSQGGTIVTPGQPDPDGGIGAFSINFTSGQVYSRTSTYSIPQVEPLTTYLIEVEVKSLDGAGFPFRWALEDFSGTGTQGGGYNLTTAPAQWTTLSRIITTGTAPAFWPMFYSFSGEAAGQTLLVFNPRLTKVVTDAVVRSTSLVRTGVDTDATSEVATRLTLQSRDAVDAAPVSHWADRALVLPRLARDNAASVEPRRGGLVSPLVSPVFATSAEGVITDAATRTYLTTRNATDTAPTTDAATRAQGVFVRGAADIVPTTGDQTGGGVLALRDGQDEAPATEAATRSTTYARSPTDTIPISEVAARLLLTERTSTDSTSTTDTTARTWVGFTRGGADLALAPQRTARVVVVGRINDSGVLHTVLAALGYADVTIDTSITTVAGLTGYDVVVEDSAYWSLTKSGLLAQAYDAGFAVLTTASDTNAGQLPFATASQGQSGFGLTPSDGQHYAAQEWTQASTESDGGVIITALRSSAVPLATWTRSADGGWGFTGIAEENPNGFGGRWVHLQPSSHFLNGNAQARVLLQRATDWLVSPTQTTDWVSREQSVYPRTADDLGPAVDSASRQTFVPRTAGDSAPTGDAATRSGTFARNPSDDAPATDDSTRIGNRYRTAADEVTPSEVAVRSAGVFARPTQDDLPGALDVASRATVQPRVADDNAPAVDQVARTAMLPRGTKDIAGTGQPVLGGLVQPVHHAVFSSGSEFVSDLAEGFVWATRQALDSAPANDEVGHETLLERTGQDVVVAQEDSPTRQIILPRLARDQASEVIWRPGGLVQPIHHPVSPYFEGTTDDVSRWVANYRRVGDESLVVGDGAVRSTVYLRTADDSAPASDAATRQHSTARTASDTTPVLTETAVRDAGLFFRTPTDTAPTFDTASQQRGLFVTANDTAPAFDAVTRWVTNSRSATEVTTLGDSASRQVFFPRAVTDEGNYTKGAYHGVIRPLVSPLYLPGYGLTDDSVRAVIYYRRLADDIIEASDEVLHLALHIRDLVEDYPLGEDAQRVVFTLRSTEDEAPAADALVGGRYFYRAAGDSAEATDAALREPITFVRDADDAAQAFDENERLSGFWRVGHDTSSLGQSTRSTGVPGLIRPVHSPLGGGPQQSSDEVIRTVIYTRMPQDAALVTDEVLSSTLHLVAVEDDAPAQDLVERTVIHRRATRDDGSSITQTRTGLVRPIIWPLYTPSDPSIDDAVRAVNYFRRVGDEAALAQDSATSVYLAARQIADTAPVTDAVVRSTVLVRTGVEVTSTADATQGQTEQARQATDATAVSDTAVRLLTPGRVVQDSADVSDAVSRQVLLLRTCGESLATSDTATRALLSVRTATDLAPAVESAVRTILFLRTSGDLAPSTDALQQQVDFAREGVEEAPASESAQSVRTVVRHAGDRVVPVNDAASQHRGVDLQGAEVLAEPTDEAGQNRLLQLTAVDVLAAPGEQATQSRVLARSTVEDDNPSRDGVQRWVDLHRGGQDEAWAGDAGRTLVSTVLADQVPTPVDSAVRVLLVLRSGADAAEASDAVARQVALGRDSVDGAPAADTVSVDRLVHRQAFDLVGLDFRDVVQRVQISDRVLHDQTPAPVDLAVRWKAAFRACADQAPATDTLLLVNLHLRALAEMLPVLLDQASRQTLPARTAFDQVLLPVDSAWWLQSHRVPFGPPVATLTSISRIKVGIEPGCDTVDLAFTFDQPVQAWAVRVNSTGPYDGTQAAAGAVQPPLSSAVATVSATALLHGANTVVVYGQGVDGRWSFHPTADLVETA